MTGKRLSPDRLGNRPCLPRKARILDEDILQSGKERSPANRYPANGLRLQGRIGAGGMLILGVTRMETIQAECPDNPDTEAPLPGQSLLHQ